MSDSNSTPTGGPGRAIRWIPLESNPDMLNALMYRLGVPRTWAFTDVWGLDPDLLALVPQPCLAVLLLFPLTPAYEAHEQQQRLLQEQRSMTSESSPPLPGTMLGHSRGQNSLFYMKQTIGNACGTVAVLHALANSRDIISLEPGPLEEFLNRARDLTPVQRAKLLEKSADIAEAHSSVATEQGQTSAPSADSRLNLHFVCLVGNNGRLYELDGRKSAPVDHGPSADLLTTAARIIRDFMARDPDNIQFNIVALTPAPDC
ncbi:ubiquitinyl hydrolase 1 [Dimargaris xerosporica]|nr:ubiquitinyl hydrolase 1 [Dimargaris xerosporica]